MVYCQLRNRTKIGVGEALCLGDVAIISGQEKAGGIALACPGQVGVWKVDAIACAAALQRAYPSETITMLGPDACYVHRVRTNQRDPWKPLRTLAAFAILLLGSALGLAWFHSDVSMPDAQMEVYRLITGRELSDPRLITIPYIVGVALGVAVFYALPSRKATTPLEVKLTEYQEDMEKPKERTYAMLRDLLAVLIGLISGSTMAVALSCAWCVLLIPSRVQDKLQAASPRLLTWAMAVGLVLAALANAADFSLHLPVFCAVLAFIPAGMFVGMLASALSEILEVAPVVMRRFRLGDASTGVRWVMLVGKGLGAVLASLVFTL